MKVTRLGPPRLRQDTITVGGVVHDAASLAPLTIEEADGTPTGAATKLVLPNGTLGLVGGVATYTPSASVTLSDATPLVESGSGSAGTGTEASRDDHVHPADGGGGGGGGSHAFLGYDTIGGSWVTMTTSRVYAKKITLAAAGIITSVDAYLRYENAAGAVDYVATALYTDNAGTPELLIAAGQPGGNTILADSINGAGGIQTGRWFTQPVGAYLPAGDYWIAVRSGGRWGIAFDGSGTDRYYTSGGGWFVDWGFYTPTTTTDRFSIRASVLTI